ncbi:hypothetical protein OKW39_008557 [Paraburkholderia sp. MM6662-R1]
MDCAVCLAWLPDEGWSLRCPRVSLRGVNACNQSGKATAADYCRWWEVLARPAARCWCTRRRSPHQDHCWRLRRPVYRRCCLQHPGRLRPRPCGQPGGRGRDFAIGEYFREPCVTNADVSLRCCTEDGRRPPEVGFQEQASNRPVLLRPKGAVVSDRGKVTRRGWQVRVEKMSESKPSDDASLEI